MIFSVNINISPKDWIQVLTEDGWMNAQVLLVRSDGSITVYQEEYAEERIILRKDFNQIRCALI